MACEFSQITDDVSLTRCGVESKLPMCRCGRRSVTACSYKLRGKKAGLSCARPLCGGCSFPQEDHSSMCESHAELTRATGMARR